MEKHKRIIVTVLAVILFIAIVYSVARYFTLKVNLIGSPVTSSLIEGDRYLDQGNNNQAVISYSKAIQYDPNSWQAYSKRGIAFVQLGQYKKAQSDLENAIRINPDFYNPYVSLSIICIAEQNYDKALEYSSKSIELNGTTNFVGYSNRGYVLIVKKKYDEAIEDCNKAISIKPDYIMAYRNRAYAYRSKGAYDEAIRDYLYVMKLQPEKQDAGNYMIGECYEAKGDYVNAVASYKKAKSLIENKKNQNAQDYQDIKNIDSKINNLTKSAKNKNK